MSELRKHEILQTIDEVVWILNRSDREVDFFYKAEMLVRLVNAYNSLKESKIYFQSVAEDSVMIH